MLVDVTVTDMDDELARFERSWYRFEVLENKPGGTAVGQVHAVDLDLAPFNRFHYRHDAPASDDLPNDASETTPPLYGRPM